ncbi:N-acetylmuramoyl-L-alanine amidase [Candidatus Micrarchaeota archaeon]|nr:N-acetylmuramoyl-L-alanine amidase [Candidatus Micrarchaeota archaeon]
MKNKTIFHLTVLVFSILLFSNLLYAKDPWESKKKHIGVIIDPGHALYGNLDPQGANLSSNKFVQYGPTSGASIVSGRSCINVPKLLQGTVESVECGKYLKVSGKGGVPRDPDDYVEPEGSAFFARALYDEIHNDFSVNSTRDLSYSLDQMLSMVRKPNVGNDWRNSATTYLCYMLKPAFSGCSKKPDAGSSPYDYDIRWKFANTIYDKEKSRDYVFISYHSNAPDPHATGTVTGWSSATDKITGACPYDKNAKFNSLALSKKFLAESLHNQISTALNEKIPSWPNDPNKAVDARTCSLFQKNPGVISGTKMPAALVEVGFHTNYNDIQNVLAYDNLEAKRVVARATFEGIKKFFNASIKTSDLSGTTKYTFTTDEDIILNGANYPKNQNVVIYVVPLKDYETYKRGDLFSSMRSKVKPITNKTDSSGKFSYKFKKGSIPAGPYNVIIAIYDPSKFEWVDAYSAMSVTKPSTSLFGELANRLQDWTVTDLMKKHN